jgi:molybdate transport system ATP-binding protein
MTLLDAWVVVRQTTFTLDVQLTAEPGDVVAVIGPNGSGKSTLLRALAGLLPVDEGRIDCDGRTWDDGAHAPVPTQRRDVGMVFQRQLLFPHLDALANVAFGPRSRGVPKRAAEETARAWLARLSVDDLAGRRPAELSGGQAQRVAIARALATDPALFLLDEPFSALDVGVAMALRIELAQHLARFQGVTVLVTHDALDAMTLANRVLVLDNGRVAQTGTPEEVAQRPQTDHVARLVGLNVLAGTSSGTDVTLSDGSRLVSATTYDGPVNACFTPTAVTLTEDEPHGSARNRWLGEVTSVVPHGAAVRVHLDAVSGLIADVTPGSAASLGLTPGRRVWATVKATEVSIYGSQDPSPDAPLPSRYA